MEKKKTYSPAIDCMRIIAILAVVAIHTSTKILQISLSSIPNFTFTFFINQISRFAVPLFFMISGFVLELNYPFNKNWLSYYKKRFSKILIPYIFWSAIYYYLIYTKHTISFFESLLGGNASYQLYFIPTLLIFYILFPLIHKAYRFMSNKWTLIILGIIQIYLLAQVYYFRPLPFFYPLAIALLNYYTFLLGMVASHHYDLLQKMFSWKTLSIGLTIILGIAVFIQGRTLYLNTHNYLYYYTQWRPSILLYTIALAISLYTVFSKLRLNEKIVRTFSKLSFFVFFIHIIVLEQFWKITGGKILTQEIPYNILILILVAGISYGIAYIAHKFHLEKITG